MTPDFYLELARLALPAAAAYVSVKVALAIAIEKAENALREAERANKRIDHLMSSKA